MFATFEDWALLLRYFTSQGSWCYWLGQLKLCYLIHCYFRNIWRMSESVWLQKCLDGSKASLNAFKLMPWLHINGHMQAHRWNKILISLVLFALLLLLMLLFFFAFFILFAFLLFFVLFLFLVFTITGAAVAGVWVARRSFALRAHLRHCTYMCVRLCAYMGNNVMYLCHVSFYEQWLGHILRLVNIIIIIIIITMSCTNDYVLIPCKFPWGAAGTYFAPNRYNNNKNHNVTY